MAEKRAWDEWDQLIAGGDPDPIDVLRVAGKYQRYLFEIQDRAVKAARAQGRSWEEIAQAVGTTRQAAWQRFSPRMPAIPAAETLRKWLGEDQPVIGLFGGTVVPRDP